MAEANEKSAEAAVAALTAELTMANGNPESIDQKAGLVPPVVAGVAALFIAPDLHFSWLQAVFLLPWVLTGGLSIWFALRTLEAKPIALGGDADQIVTGTRFEPAAFNRAVAGSLAMAINKHSALTQWKGKRLNWSMRLAGVTFLLLAAARLAGGL